MSFRLKDRNRPLPNGISVMCPGTNYKAPNFASFSAQVDGVMQARLANPGLCARYRLPTERTAVEDYVDKFLGKVAHDNGWVDFYVGGASEQSPPSQRSASARIAGVAKAAGVQLEWLKSGDEAVPAAQSSKRAEVCSKCPMNNHDGDWLSLFTVPMAASVRRALESRTAMKLTTPFDDKLGVCDACDCPLLLKVHMPLEKIKPLMPPEIFNALHPACWIRSEWAT